MKRRPKSKAVREAMRFIRKCQAMKQAERAERERKETERLIDQAMLADGDEMTA